MNFFSPFSNIFTFLIFQFLFLNAQGRRTCEFFDKDNLGGNGGVSPEEAPSNGSLPTEMICGKESHFCYALFWTDSLNQTIFIKQGCWEASIRTHASTPSQCSANCTAYTKPHQPNHPHFCCCQGDNCNALVTLEEIPPEEYEDQIEEKDKHFFEIIFGAVLVSAMLGFAVAAAFIRKKGFGKKTAGEEIYQEEIINESSFLINDPFDLNQQDTFNILTQIATGRWGTIYTATSSRWVSPVALKVYTQGHREFYENERFIYSLLKHPNILHYHGHQEIARGDELLLALAFELVDLNLRDYLQTTEFSVDRAIEICLSISSGISYLHNLDANLFGGAIVAHRDLTPRNILIHGQSGKILLCDFGLSLLTKSSKYFGANGKERQAEFCSLTSSLQGAGTLRYMAPELLEGAVNLKDCENALKQADVYSLALVLWEVCNACRPIRFDEPTTTHQAPYDDDPSEGKDQITMETLTLLVVQHRSRPPFHNWMDSPLTRALRDTLSESWDSEPDARLTSLCILERLTEMKLNVRKLMASPPPKTQLEIKSNKIEPWAGRNVCLERNLLMPEYSNATISTEVSDTSGGPVPPNPTHTDIPKRNNITFIQNKF